MLFTVFTYIPTLPLAKILAFPNVIFPLLITSVLLSATIPNSAALEVPTMLPVFVKFPPPLAKIPTIPAVVFVLLSKLIFRLLVAFAPEYKVAIPLPAVLPEYL